MDDQHFKEQLEKHHNAQIHPEAQEMINKPLEKGLDETMQQYLDMVIGMLESGEINPMIPSSLLNQEVYTAMSEELQDKADLNCVNLCGKLRQILMLWQQAHTQSFQMELMIKDIFQTKDRLEQEIGDVLKI